jgi:hypothetical protein
MNLMKRSILLTICVLLCIPLGAQQYVFMEPTAPAEKSFAIIVDDATFENCKDAILSYRNSVEKEGLAVYVAARKWQDPESVKTVLKDLYKNHCLAGAVFVGNVPVAMIRGAQHLTSAFKMDQKQPMFDSSVPSDRFYDDFNLIFDFIGADKDHPGFFYYNLSPLSPQFISCDIFTGRIRPYLKGKAGYDQLKAYFKKLVAIRNEENPLDKIVSYTGHGSFSNSMAAWKDETVTLKEQMPEAFKTADGARFYFFPMYPYMKYTIADELQRKDLDLMLFHEHGTPDRQWMTGEPPAEDEDSYLESGKRQARGYCRTKLRYGAKSKEEAMEKVMEQDGIDSSWVAGAFDPKVMEQDSLMDLRTGIVLSDVSIINPNSLLTIFDACYNGDFREQDFIADRFIFSEGRSVVCVGNTVNVLQDKSSADLMGMLSCGYTVGEWMQMTNILESHIIGDPTFCFSYKYSAIRPDIDGRNLDSWLRYAEENGNSEVRSLALYKLYALRYERLPELLLKIYKSSDSYMLRLQCLHLCAHYNDGNYIEMLKLASDDPYEFIRRQAAFYMGKVGDESFLPYLASLWVNDYMSERVVFNIGFSAGHFRDSLLLTAVDSAIDAAPYIFDKHSYKAMAAQDFGTGISMAEETVKALRDTTMKPRSRSIMVSNLRNNPYPWMVDDVLKVLSNPQESEELRIQVAEVLGWYVRCPKRDKIVRTCSLVLEDPSAGDELRAEVQKTINRLENYMR